MVDQQVLLRYRSHKIGETRAQRAYIFQRQAKMRRQGPMQKL